MLLFLQGCLWKPNPQVIYLKPEYRVYPIEQVEPLEEVKIYPLYSTIEENVKNGIVAGIKEDDVRKMQRNTVRLYKWGIQNQNTVELINEMASIVKEAEKPQE